MMPDTFTSSKVGRRQLLQGIATVAIGVAALPLVSCGGAASPSASAYAGATLNTIMTPGLVQGPVILADKLGYFKDEGVTATVKIANVSATDRIQLLSGNQIQLSTTTPSASTNNAIQRGAPLLGVATGSIDSAKFPAGVYITSEKAWNSGVKTIKDLKGRKVALFIGWDGIAGRGLVLLARKAGLDPFNDFQISVWNSFGDMSAALVGGQVDAMISQEPQTTQLTTQSGAHIIAQLNEVLPDEAGFLMFMNSDWVKANQEGTIRVLKAYLRGVDTFIKARDSKWQSNPEVIQALADAFEMKPDLIRQIGAPNFAADGAIDLEKVDAALQYSKALGNIDTLVPASKWVDQSYAKEAYKRLKDEKKI